MCTLTEKDRQSSRLRSSALFHVKLSVCIRATIAKGEETDGKATFRILSCHTEASLKLSGLS